MPEFLTLFFGCEACVAGLQHSCPLAVQHMKALQVKSEVLQMQKYLKEAVLSQRADRNIDWC